MNRYRIFWNVTESWSAEVDAESESAARQAFIDHDLEKVNRYRRQEQLDSVELLRMVVALPPASSPTVEPGDRVRLLAPLANGDASVIPVEDVPVGTEGTVDWIGTVDQIGVSWDNGCRLMLIPSRDRFEKIDPEVQS